MVKEWHDTRLFKDVYECHSNQNKQNNMAGVIVFPLNGNYAV